MPIGTPEQWSSPPFDALIDDSSSTIHGRGSVDMKGGLVTAIAALVWAADNGADVAGLLTADEEIGSKGVAVAVDELPEMKPTFDYFAGSYRQQDFFRTPWRIMAACGSSWCGCAWFTSRIR